MATPLHLTGSKIGIEIEVDGPYRVTNVTLEATFNGAGASQVKYALCRCGQSTNNPFCDSTHCDIGWRDGQGERS